MSEPGDKLEGKQPSAALTFAGSPATKRIAARGDIALSVRGAARGGEAESLRWRREPLPCAASPLGALPPGALIAPPGGHTAGRPGARVEARTGCGSAAQRKPAF